MPKGIPKKGFRRSQKLSSVSLEEIERNLVKRSPDLLEKLEALTKPLPCPNCGGQVRGPDRDALIYLCNRAMGMPKQRQELDITQSFQLSADQIDVLIERHLPALAALVAERYHLALPEPIEGEYKEVDTSQNCTFTK